MNKIIAGLVLACLAVGLAGCDLPDIEAQFASNLPVIACDVGSVAGAVAIGVGKGAVKQGAKGAAKASATLCK